MAHTLSRVAAHIPRKVLVRLVAFHFKMLEPELRKLDHFVPPARVAIDVGTWWGPWSWWLSKRVPHVEGFEPNTSICERLRGVLPSNVHLNNIALSDQRGDRSCGHLVASWERSADPR